MHIYTDKEFAFTIYEALIECYNKIINCPIQMVKEFEHILFPKINIWPKAVENIL